MLLLKKTVQAVLYFSGFGILSIFSLVFFLKTVFAQEYLMNVPVPAITIYPGEIITDAMLTDIKKQQEAGKLFALQRSDVIGKQTHRTLLPGNLIPKNALDEPNVFINGKLVTMRYVQNGLDITSIGLALQSATIGEQARARNVDSGLVVSGIVMADGSLKLGDP